MTLLVMFQGATIFLSHFVLESKQLFRLGSLEDPFLATLITLVGEIMFYNMVP